VAVFFDNYIDITPPNITGWQTVDLSTHGVPANAVCIIRSVHANGKRIGARKHGSVDNRIAFAYGEQTSVYAGCDGNKKEVLNGI
jgi:hypothetical protein